MRISDTLTCRHCHTAVKRRTRHQEHCSDRCRAAYFRRLQHGAAIERTYREWLAQLQRRDEGEPMTKRTFEALLRIELAKLHSHLAPED